jgi:hypothetical protein
MSETENTSNTTPVAPEPVKPTVEPAPEPEVTKSADSGDTAGGFGPEKSVEDKDAQAATAPGHDSVNPEHGSSEDWTVKSRKEEEEDQHARREAANAEVEKTVAQAETTPF